MIASIGGGSGFGGVAEYCLGRGGEGKEEEPLPEQDAGGEQERQREETPPRSARERQQEQASSPIQRDPRRRREDGERKRRARERRRGKKAARPGAKRVLWTETRNLATNDVMRGSRIMEATARDAPVLKKLAGVKATGRKLKKPVVHYSLSWDQGERPDRQEMSGAVEGSLQALGLQDHQSLVVAHGDTTHPHVHVIVNRVHPETGKAANMGRDRIKLSKWAEGYERKQGKIRCHQRVRNNERRARGRWVRGRWQRHRGRWRRERMSSGPSERPATPAGLSGPERVEWKKIEAGRWDTAQYFRDGHLADLSRKATGDWRELYARHQKERAAETKASSSVWRRFQRWREKGSHLGQLRPTLTRDSELWRGWSSQMEARQKRERAELGRSHSRAARTIERGITRDYREHMAGAVPSAKYEVRRQEYSRWEQQRSFQRQQEISRQSQIHRGRERDAGPER